MIVTNSTKTLPGLLLSVILLTAAVYLATSVVTLVDLTNGVINYVNGPDVIAILTGSMVLGGACFLVLKLKTEKPRAI